MTEGILNLDALMGQDVSEVETFEFTFDALPASLVGMTVKKYEVKVFNQDNADKNTTVAVVIECEVVEVQSTVNPDVDQATQLMNKKHEEMFWVTPGDTKEAQEKMVRSIGMLKKFAENIGVEDITGNMKTVCERCIGTDFVTRIVEYKDKKDPTITRNRLDFKGIGDDAQA